MKAFPSFLPHCQDPEFIKSHQIYCLLLEGCCTERPRRHEGRSLIAPIFTAGAVSAKKQIPSTSYFCCYFTRSVISTPLPLDTPVKLHGLTKEMDDKAVAVAVDVGGRVRLELDGDVRSGGVELKS